VGGFLGEKNRKDSLGPLREMFENCLASVIQKSYVSIQLEFHLE
jgi:hypothetical protein